MERMLKYWIPSDLEACSSMEPLRIEREIRENVERIWVWEFNCNKFVHWRLGLK